MLKQGAVGGGDAGGSGCGRWGKGDEGGAGLEQREHDPGAEGDLEGGGQDGERGPVGSEEQGDLGGEEAGQGGEEEGRGCW